MYPVLLKFQLLGKEIIIGTYGVLIVLSMAAGIFLTLRIARYFKYKKDDVLNYSLLVLVSSFIGTFLVGFLVFLPERIEEGFFNYQSALVSWGGLLGGLVALYLIKKKWSANLLNLADIGTPAYLIGFGIGRIGCFFGGCCFGIPTSSPIGVKFIHQLAPASSMNAHLIPTQLISAAFLIVTGLIFIAPVIKRRIPGFVFFSSTIVYSIFRFIIEFFRADHRKFFFKLSDGQLFSLGFFILGVIGLIYVAGKKEKLIKNLKYLHNNSGRDI